MNWTGGNLSRTRQRNSASSLLTAKQKQHFAKQRNLLSRPKRNRNGRDNGTHPSASQSSKMFVPENFDYGKARASRNEDVKLRGPVGNEEKENRGEIPETRKRRRIDASISEDEETSILLMSKRRRLLENNDWTGLKYSHALQKALNIDNPTVASQSRSRHRPVSRNGLDQPRRVVTRREEKFDSPRTGRPLSSSGGSTTSSISSAPLRPFENPPDVEKSSKSAEFPFNHHDLSSSQRSHRANRLPGPASPKTSLTYVAALNADSEGSGDEEDEEISSSVREEVSKWLHGTFSSNRQEQDKGTGRGEGEVVGVIEIEDDSLSDTTSSSSIINTNGELLLQKAFRPATIAVSPPRPATAEPPTEPPLQAFAKYIAKGRARVEREPYSPKIDVDDPAVPRSFRWRFKNRASDRSDERDHDQTNNRPKNYWRSDEDFNPTATSPDYRPPPSPDHSRLTTRATNYRTNDHSEIAPTRTRECKKAEAQPQTEYRSRVQAYDRFGKPALKDFFEGQAAAHKKAWRHRNAQHSESTEEEEEEYEEDRRWDREDEWEREMIRREETRMKMREENGDEHLLHIHHPRTVSKRMESKVDGFLRIHSSGEEGVGDGGHAERELSASVKGWDGNADEVEVVSKDEDLLWGRFCGALSGRGSKRKRNE